MRTTTTILVCLALLAAAQARAEGVDFVVLQAGQPGSTEDARPVMDALAGYLESRLGPGFTVRGRYLNDPEKTRGFEPGANLRLAIVSLGFYLENASRLGLEPLASTRPGGRDKDAWRIVVPVFGPDDIRDIKGRLQGTMLFESRAATRLLFKGTPCAAEIEGGFRPLRAVRQALGGEIAGAVLDQDQFEAVMGLPLAKGLKVVLTRAGLPTGPVVWFGPAGALARRLARILLDMVKDPEAQEVLAGLRTRGFGPPDPALAGLLRECVEP
ncbi:MAG: hypothetical protein PHV85_05060 [Desulfovibrionaceae bacterium]|nr:hypothetical protein [Desulfovibrionaceae bacterium]